MFQTTDTMDSTRDTMRGATRLAADNPLAGITVGKIIAVFWHNKLLILGMAILSAVGMIMFIASVPPLYTATSQIIIQPTELRALDKGSLSSNQMPDENVVQVESQVRVISSDNVLTRVVINERLDKDPEFASHQGSGMRKFAFQLLGLRGVDRLSDAADPTLGALSELRRRVRVKRAERTYVVDVSVTAESPAKAVRLGAAIGQAYLAEQTAAKSDAAQRVSDSLQSRLSELRERVRNAEERVEEFKSKKDIVGLSGVTVNEQQLAELNAQVSRSRNRAAEAKARSDQIQALLRSGGNVGAIPEAIQSTTIAALRAQYAEITRKKADLLSQLAPTHPFVVDVEAQLQGIRRLINEELGRITESARNDYLREEANEAALSETLEKVKRKVMITNEALVTLRELQRDAETSRTLYESYLTRSRETGELKGLDTNNVRIISMGEPLRRSWPPSDSVLMLGALIFGLAAGTGWAFWRALGTFGDRPAKRIAALPGLGLLAELPDDGGSVGLTALNAPKSQFAAEIRRLYSALQATSGQSVLIVAPHEDSNTAKVALNLASIAAANQTVLLIDGDIRQGTISAIYGQPIKFGLVDVASGQAALAAAIAKDRRTNIDLLPLVSRNSRISSKLDRRGIQRAFAQAKGYDFVIVAATVRKGELGASLFSPLVDNIVVALKASSSPNNLDEVYAAVGPERRKILGSVITGAGVR
jgi:succinoglycan biosynthesis transport protein ExoP